MQARGWNHAFHAEHGNTAHPPPAPHPAPRECRIPLWHSRACGCCKPWNHCSTCNCLARAERSSVHIPEGAAHQGSAVRASPVRVCANPGRHSWGCGCCRVWDHCATCNCYWHDSDADFSHIQEQDVEEGIVQDVERIDRSHAELGGLDEEDILLRSRSRPSAAPRKGTGWTSTMVPGRIKGGGVRRPTGRTTT